jgi:hypothetical protein
MLLTNELAACAGQAAASSQGLTSDALLIQFQPATNHHAMIALKQRLHHAAM